VLLGVLTVILFVLSVVLALPTSPCPFSGCFPGPRADGWVVVSALGTLAAGIGAIISGIAAILALRAAATAVGRNATPSPAKDQEVSVRAKKPRGKRRKKRLGRLN
jgi:hypothetical protein